MLDNLRLWYQTSSLQGRSVWPAGLLEAGGGPAPEFGFPGLCWTWPPAAGVERQSVAVLTQHCSACGHLTTPLPPHSCWPATVATGPTTVAVAGSPHLAQYLAQVEIDTLDLREFNKR